MIKIVSILVGGGVLFGGLSVLIHMCSKNGYSISYQSTKRKFKIYPNKENLKLPPNQSDD